MNSKWCPTNETGNFIHSVTLIKLLSAILIDLGVIFYFGYVCMKGVLHKIFCVKLI